MISFEWHWTHVYLKHLNLTILYFTVLMTIWWGQHLCHVCIEALDAIILSGIVEWRVSDGFESQYLQGRGVGRIDFANLQLWFWQSVLPVHCDEHNTGKGTNTSRKHWGRTCILSRIYDRLWIGTIGIMMEVFGRLCASGVLPVPASKPLWFAHASDTMHCCWSEIHYRQNTVCSCLGYNALLLQWDI